MVNNRPLYLVTNLLNCNIKNCHKATVITEQSNSVKESRTNGDVSCNANEDWICTKAGYKIK